jgi:hypothetical protein
VNLSPSPYIAHDDSKRGNRAVSDEIAQIRALLASLELKIGVSPDEAALRDFAALELPEILSDVIDYLMPQLTPYEAAFYFYLFRHSILSSGTQHVRVSVRGIRAIVASSRSDADTGVSYGQVAASLKQLEDKKAIRKEAEPNREGTLYKVFIPEEIESCRLAMKERLIAPTPVSDPQAEVDYYNVRENRALIFERDGYQCQYCKKQLTRFTATLDHITPVSKGGGNEYDNVITACLGCNSRKTGKPLSDFLADADLRSGHASENH